MTSPFPSPDYTSATVDLRLPLHRDPAHTVTIEGFEFADSSPKRFYPSALEIEYWPGTSVVRVDLARFHKHRDEYVWDKCPTVRWSRRESSGWVRAKADRGWELEAWQFSAPYNQQEPPGWIRQLVVANTPQVLLIARDLAAEAGE